DDLKELAELEPLPRAVVYPVPAPGRDNPAADAHAVTERVLAVVQQLLTDDRLADLHLVVVTRGATTGELATAPIWGLLRSTQPQHPGRIPLHRPAAEAAVPPGLLAAILARGPPPYPPRDGALPPPRLPTASHNRSAPKWDPEGTVLIAGGTGTL